MITGEFEDLFRAVTPDSGGSPNWSDVLPNTEKLAQLVDIGR